MKKFLLMTLVLLGTVVSFSSCGSDDNDDNGKTNSEVVDYGDRLVLTLNVSGYFDAQFVANFQNDICTGGYAEVKWATQAMADACYKEMAKEDPTVIINGRTITQDMSKSFKGYDKAMAKMELEALAAQYKGMKF